MITPEDIGEEWLSRSDEERDDLLTSRWKQQLAQQDEQALPPSERPRPPGE